MSTKTRLLAGLTIGCALSAPAAFADDEQYRGFYFGVWGGSGSADLPSRTAFDNEFSNAWLADIFADVAEDIEDSTPTIPDNATLTLQQRNSSSLDDSQSVYGAQVGYRWNQYFAAEVGYAHLGEAKYDFSGVLNYTNVLTGSPTISEDVDFQTAYTFTSAGPTLAAVGLFPIGAQFELQGKLGLFFADTRQTVRIRDVEESVNIYHRRMDASQNELFAAIGATWVATESLSLRIEYQRFFDVGDDEKTVETDVDVINVGVLFR